MKRNEKKNMMFLATGRIFSTIGDSIYQLAVIWYVFYLTNNTIYTGIAVTCVAIPQVLNFLFGPIIEKYNKKHLLANTQLFQFILMAIIPLSIYLGYENVYLVLLIVFLLSFLENFQGTAEMSIVPKIISKNKVGGYNSKINTVQQIIGLLASAVFSLMILYVTIQNIYIFNAITFLIAFAFFKMITYYEEKRKNPGVTEEVTYTQNLNEGWKYFKVSKLLAITLPLSIANAILSGVNAVLPLYAMDLGSASYFGLMMFAISIGLTIGASISTVFLKFKFGIVMSGLAFFMFIFWTASIIIGIPYITLILLAISLIPLGIMNILLITYTQVTTEDYIISRVLSISDSLLFAAIPIGALLGGVIGELLSAKFVMLFSGTAFLVIALLYISNKNLRNIPSIKDFS